MFDYTVTAAKKIYEDFKKFGRVCDVITQILYIAYLTYSVFAQTGRWWIKAILLGISVGYFIFYIVTQCSKKYQLGKRGKRVFTWSKLGLKLFELGVAFYSISVTTNDATTTSVILLAMMLVGWLLQVVFDVIVSILENRATLFFEAVKADWEEMKRPLDNVSGFMKKLTGKPVEPAPEKTKQRLWLDEHVAEIRKDKRDKKVQKKQEQKERKQALKQQKQAERLAKRQPKTQNVQTPTDTDDKKKKGKK